MEACVVGGGPVGLFAAACLHQRGVEVEVIDAESERPVRSYACGLHPETLRLFDGLGLMPALGEVAHRVDRAIISRGTERVAVADFAGLSGRFPHVLTLPQSDLQDLLARELDRREVLVGTLQEVTRLSLKDDFVSMDVESRGAPARGSLQSGGEPLGATRSERHASYLIGADGYHSMCREAAGIELIDLQQSEAFAMFEFEADLGAFEHEAHLVLNAEDTSAFWPLGPQRGRWTFQISEDLDEAPSLALLADLLERRAPWFRPRPEQLAWSSTSYFERRIARRFGSGRVWLAGDAAHVTTPLGFQNMNRGFVEASDLSTVINGTLQGDPAAAGGFERFERAQQAEWRRLFGLGMRVVSEGSLSAIEGARLVACLPASGRDLEALLGQLGLRVVPTWGSVRPGC